MSLLSCSTARTCRAPIVVLQLLPLSTNTTVPYKEQQSGCALQVLAVHWIHWRKSVCSYLPEAPEVKACEGHNSCWLVSCCSMIRLYEPGCKTSAISSRVWREVGVMWQDPHHLTLAGARTAAAADAE